MMKNNENQLKKGNGDNLPIVSDNEEVQRNCMRLYVYLVSISKFAGKNNPRFFTQKDFSVNKIKETIHMHPDTIKKYWHLLEQHKLIVYEGPNSDEYTLMNEDEWKSNFSKRNKHKAAFYRIPKKNPYRIMPRETIEKIQKEYLVDEMELKLYFMLANMQETFCYMKSPERQFSLFDLRTLLKLSKDSKNNKAIIRALLWLRELGLVEYKIAEDKNTNLGTSQYVFELISVNYYTNGGTIGKILESENSKLDENIKNQLLNNQMIDFSDL